MTEERITVPNPQYHDVTIIADSDQSRLMYATYALRHSIKAYDAGTKLALAAIHLIEPVEIAQFTHMRLSAFRDMYAQPQRFSYTFRDSADDLVLMQGRLQREAMAEVEAAYLLEAESCPVR